MGQIIDFSEDKGKWMCEQLCSDFPDQRQIKDASLGLDMRNAEPLPSYACASGMSPFGDYFSKLSNIEAAVLGVLTTCMWINTQEKKDCETCTCECKALCELFKDVFEKECEKIKKEK